MSFFIVPKLTFKYRVCYRVCYRVFCHEIAKEGDCKVVIYNYILCRLYSMKKSVVIAFNFVPCILWDFIVLSLVLSWSRLKLN